jgi:hypothetical protein
MTTLEADMHARGIALLVAALLLAACTTTTGSGVLKTESRPVSGFSAIELSGVGNLAVEQAGTASVSIEALTIEAEDNILPLLTSDVSDGTLRLGVKSNTSLNPTKPINYRVTVKDLTGLTVSGAGTVTASKIATTRLHATISGSGMATVSGRADSQDVTISGSGNWQAGDLSSKVVNAQITGSGNAEVMVSEALNAQISGSGTVRYSGNPSTIAKQITGAGQLVRK